MLLVFGLGYAARAIAARAGMPVVGTTRDGREGTLRFDAADAALAAATHVLSSVPPDEAGDPVLARLGTVRRAQLSASPRETSCPRRYPAGRRALSAITSPAIASSAPAAASADQR